MGLVGIAREILQGQDGERANDRHLRRGEPAFQWPKSVRARADQWMSPTATPAGQATERAVAVQGLHLASRSGIGRRIPGRLKPPRGLFSGHRRTSDPDRRDTRSVVSDGGSWQDGAHRVRGSPGECGTSRDIQRRRRAKIRPVIHVLATDLFRGHVLRRAERDSSRSGSTKLPRPRIR